jgi:hypothetical protein
VPQSAANGSQRRSPPTRRTRRAYRDDEAQARRLHHVDGQRDREDDHQAPVRGAERRVLGRADDDVGIERRVRRASFLGRSP